MRNVTIPFHNNQKLEVFIEELKSFFEIWVVGPVNGSRMILNHHLTHDDLEAQLEYSNPGDLVWQRAERSQIPEKVHAVAEEAVAIIEKGAYSDFEKEHNQPLAYHIFSALNVPSLDRREWNFAKKAILGEWTDDVAILGLEPEAKLKWSCPVDRPHPFNLGARGGAVPDWWSFSAWQFHLMNRESQSGMRIAVLNVNEHELHICCDNHPHRLANVFRRKGALSIATL